jgi:hypothetical protein
MVTGRSILLHLQLWRRCGAKDLPSDWPRSSFRDAGFTASGLEYGIWTFQKQSRLALSSIWVQKLRSALTLLGMIIGVTAVVIIVSLIQGFQSLCR